MDPHPHNVIDKPPQSLRTEIAVIGSGPGGAITACLLAEAGRDVLLIEDGPFLALESCSPFTREEMVRKYRNGGITVTMGAAKIAYVEGRCVGGGSEINSGLYHRTPSEVLEEWVRDFQVAEITEADLRPHFEACEKDLHVSTMDTPAPPASLKLHQGATALGWKSMEVPRWFRAGTKQSMTKSFVPRFLAAGGKLLPQTRVRQLRQRGNCWLIFGERTSGLPLSVIEIEADTIFVAAGAIQTPALLRRSGIRRNIGNSLRMHPTVKVVAQFPEEVNNPTMGVPVHQVKEFAPRFSFGCSISSPPHLALALSHYPDAVKNLRENWRHMAVYYAMISGGEGTVRALPGYRDPLVRFRLQEKDWTDLSEGLANLSQCLVAAGARKLYPAPWPAGPKSQTDLMTIHLFSSCPMGEDRNRCAADSFGRVHGVKNLYIADGSLLCTAPGVNPQGSIMAISRRNALRFLGK